MPLLAATVGLGVFAVGGIATGISSKVNTTRQQSAAKKKIAIAVEAHLHRDSFDFSEEKMSWPVESTLNQGDFCGKYNPVYRRVGTKPRSNCLERQRGQRNLISGLKRVRDKNDGNPPNISSSQVRFFQRGCERRRSIKFNHSDDSKPSSKPRT